MSASLVNAGEGGSSVFWVSAGGVTIPVLGVIYESGVGRTYRSVEEVPYPSVQWFLKRYLPEIALHVAKLQSMGLSLPMIVTFDVPASKQFFNILIANPVEPANDLYNSYRLFTDWSHSLGSRLVLLEPRENVPEDVIILLEEEGSNKIPIGYMHVNRFRDLLDKLLNLYNMSISLATLANETVPIVKEVSRLGTVYRLENAPLRLLITGVGLPGLVMGLESVRYLPVKEEESNVLTPILPAGVKYGDLASRFRRFIRALRYVENSGLPLPYNINELVRPLYGEVEKHMGNIYVVPLYASNIIEKFSNVDERVREMINTLEGESSNTTLPFLVSIYDRLRKIIEPRLSNLSPIGKIGEELVTFIISWLVNNLHKKMPELMKQFYFYVGPRSILFQSPETLSALFWLAPNEIEKLPIPLIVTGLTFEKVRPIKSGIYISSLLYPSLVLAYPKTEEKPSQNDIFNILDMLASSLIS